MEIIAILVFLFTAVYVEVRLIEKRSIYFPTRDVFQTPAQAGITFEDVWLSTQDGQKLHGWFMDRGKSSKTILFFHGNGGNIAHRVEKLGLLFKAGFSVFIIDYRGYGKSSGFASEQGIYKDAVASYLFLKNEKQIKPKDIIVYGESLGAAAAVYIGSEYETGPVVIEGGFTSVKDMAKHMYPFLPRVFLRTKFDSLSRISRVRSGVLIFHSREDSVVPFKFSKRLFDAACPPKRFVELKGDHNNNVFDSKEVYINSLLEFSKTGR